MADLTPDISDNAKAPRMATGDQGSMQQHSLPDQIAADKYLKAAAAASASPIAGIRRFKIRRGGAVNFNDRGNR